MTKGPREVAPDVEAMDEEKGERLRVVRNQQTSFIPVEIKATGDLQTSGSELTGNGCCPDAGGRAHTHIIVPLEGTKHGNRSCRRPEIGSDERLFANTFEPVAQTESREPTTYQQVSQYGHFFALMQLHGRALEGRCYDLNDDNRWCSSKKRFELTNDFVKLPFAV